MASKEKTIKMYCEKCQNIIKGKEYLTCFVCRKHYERECTNVSSKRYYLMSSESKQKWKCTSCIKNQTRNAKKTLLVTTSPEQSDVENQTSKTSKSSNKGNENITLRIKCNKNNSSLTRLSGSGSDSNPTADVSPKSSSDVSLGENSQIMDLKNEIDQLRQQLDNARKEIMQLNLDNTELRNAVEQYREKDAPCKKQCDNPIGLKESTNIKSLNNESAEQETANHIMNEPCQHDEINLNARVNTITTENTTESELRIHGVGRCRRTFKNTKLAGQFNLKKNKIYILGDQQATGIATALIKLRSNYKNPCNYDISGFAYPNAPSDIILRKSLDELNKNDWIIVSLGSNDTNPYKIFAELYAFLKLHTDKNVLITKISSSRFLNECKINNLLNSLSACYENCSFISVPSRNIVNTKQNILYAINKEIDTKDYDKYFLRGKLSKSGFTKRHECKPGTIPYYFSKMRCNVFIDPKQRTLKKSDRVEINVTSPKKGTIPFYFKKISNDATKNNSDNQFFR